MRNIHLLLCLLFGWLPLSAQIDDGWVEAGNAAYNSSLVSVEFLSDGQAVVEIANLQGVVVLQVEAILPQRLKIDVSGMPAGVYVVRLGERARLFIKG